MATAAAVDVIGPAIQTPVDALTLAIQAVVDALRAKVARQWAPVCSFGAVAHEDPRISTHGPG
jgi:hypothetical protein